MSETGGREVYQRNETGLERRRGAIASARACRPNSIRGAIHDGVSLQRNITLFPGCTPHSLHMLRRASVVRVSEPWFQLKCGSNVNRSPRSSRDSAVAIRLSEYAQRGVGGIPDRRLGLTGDGGFAAEERSRYLCFSQLPDC